MAFESVAPYRHSGRRAKSDGVNMAAICEALHRSDMRFVPIKILGEQRNLCLHWVRQGFIEPGYSAPVRFFRSARSAAREPIHILFENNDFTSSFTSSFKWTPVLLAPER